MTLTANIIPLTNTPQTLTIVLGGVTYNLLVYWNQQNLSWVLDIADSSGNPLVQGIPLVTGTDLLFPYAYLGFNGMLIVQTTGNVDAIPTFENLGDTSNLYFVTVSA